MVGPRENRSLPAAHRDSSTRLACTHLRASPRGKAGHPGAQREAREAWTPRESGTPRRSRRPPGRAGGGGETMGQRGPMRWVSRDEAQGRDLELEMGVQRSHRDEISSLRWVSRDPLRWVSRDP